MSTPTIVDTDPATPAPQARRGATTPAAPPLPGELEALLRRMRLPHLRTAAQDVLATARSAAAGPGRQGGVKALR
jgi:hypothetical protein